MMINTDFKVLFESMNDDHEFLIDSNNTTLLLGTPCFGALSSRPSRTKHKHP